MDNEQNPYREFLDSLKSGYVIVKTFASLYREYATRYSLWRDLYAIPRIDKNPEQYSIRYQGLDRDALTSFEKSDNLAEIRLAELEKENKSYDGLVFDYPDVQNTAGYLQNTTDYEIVWARIAGSGIIPRSGFMSIGFEPNMFVGDYFAAQCDCMLFPRWHGTDDEGVLFLKHFHKLNQYGLFNTIQEAEDFLKYYLSFDWTETGIYKTIEVFTCS